MKTSPTIFEEHEIRHIDDDKPETWFFSVVLFMQQWEDRLKSQLRHCRGEVTSSR